MFKIIFFLHFIIAFSLTVYFGFFYEDDRNTCDELLGCSFINGTKCPSLNCLGDSYCCKICGRGGDEEVVLSSNLLTNDPLKPLIVVISVVSVITIGLLFINVFRVGKIIKIGRFLRITFGFLIVTVLCLIGGLIIFLFIVLALDFNYYYNCRYKFFIFLSWEVILFIVLVDYCFNSLPRLEIKWNKKKRINEAMMIENQGESAKKIVEINENYKSKNKYCNLLINKLLTYVSNVLFLWWIFFAIYFFVIQRLL